VQKKSKRELFNEPSWDAAYVLFPFRFGPKGRGEHGEWRENGNSGMLTYRKLHGGVGREYKEGHSSSLSQRSRGTSGTGCRMEGPQQGG